jgi:hypothetical protein
LPKKLPKNAFMIAVIAGMLFPNERIGRHGEKVVEIVLAKRPEMKEIALQTGLEVKWQS